MFVTGCGLGGVQPVGQVGMAIGPQPDCPYGYYGYAPYDCAPYGYYGPEWFNDGMFIGAGPWFDGDEHFWGHVDRRFDPHHGYRGEYPHRGDRANRPLDHIQNFHGNAMRDGRGHERGGRHGWRH
jgi:hypothetical protein